ncbi:MAG: DUF2207 domain-containing protein, partial [Actinomycetota bacterium]
MGIGRRLLAGLVCSAGVVLFAVVLFAGPAGAKSYSFPRVVVDIVVRPDGSFTVHEERTFDFDGSFTRGFLEIPRGGYRIGDVRVSEGGRAYRPGRRGVRTPDTFVFDEVPRYNIEWYYAAADERRTFVIDYVVTGAITRYDDVAEMFWKFIGPEWDTRTDEVVAVVHLPAGASASEIRAWGHGPLNGSVRIVDGRTARWQVSNLKAFTFVEGRLALPTHLVPGAPAASGDRLPTILAEEQRLADEANEARAAAGRRNAWTGALGAGSAGLFLALFFIYGREPRTERVPEHIPEPPSDLAPAFVGYLMRGGVATQDMTATLMDLASRGWLAIEEEREPRKHGEFEYRYR